MSTFNSRVVTVLQALLGDSLEQVGGRMTVYNSSASGASAAFASISALLSNSQCQIGCFLPCILICNLKVVGVELSEVEL